MKKIFIVGPNERKKKKKDSSSLFWSTKKPAQRRIPQGEDLSAKKKGGGRPWGGEDELRNVAKNWGRANNRTNRFKGRIKKPVPILQRGCQTSSGYRAKS